jgi:serine/threonine protein kinase
VLRLQHPNLARVLAVSFAKLPLMLVTDYMSNGDLKNYIKKCRPCETHPPETLDAAKLEGLLVQVAQALRFLESRKVVHRDIVRGEKTQNKKKKWGWR